jgi:hypothetical protein
VFRARRATAKKRSIQVVCEHFLPLHNAALGAYTIFEMGSTYHRGGQIAKSKNKKAYSREYALSVNKYFLI